MRMAIVTLGELLDRARSFELRLESFYAEVRDRTPDNGVRLLTYYLSKHRRHQDLVFANFDAGRIASLRKAEFKHAIGFDPEERFRVPVISPDTVTGEMLLQAAGEYDQALINLYRTLLDQPLIDEIKDVLESLLRIEERDLVMLKKMQAMHYF